MKFVGKKYGIFLGSIFLFLVAFAMSIRIAHASPPPDSNPVGPRGYTFCAVEGNTCNIQSGIANIAYGANGSFYYMASSGNVACNSHTFGGEPTSANNCFYQKITPPSGYTFCAGEGGQKIDAGSSSCTFTGKADIWFGNTADGKFTTATNSTSPFSCTLANFSKDPDPGAFKDCFFKSTGGSGDTDQPQQATTPNICANHPNGLSVAPVCSGSQSNITFHWTAVTGATQYSIAWKDGPSLSGTRTVTASTYCKSGKCSYTITGWLKGAAGNASLYTSQPCTSPKNNISFTTAKCPATSPTPGGSSGGTAQLPLVIGLPGIGFNAVGGAAPKHLTRSITVELYDSTVTNPSGPDTHALSTSPGTVTYDNSSDNNAGYFVGNITLHLPSTPAANNRYKVLVEVPQYLYKLAVNAADGTQTFTIENGSLVTASPLLLLPGDAQAASGGKNLLDIDDYTQLLSCFHDASSCATTADGIPVADLDDNGSIDIVDLNLFIRSLFQLQQIQADPPICNGLSCQGD